MNDVIRPVRGTHDWQADETAQYQHIVSVARSVAERFGCGEMMTPIFEFSQVFHRTLGDTSDVVSKETYTFDDRGGESLTLRPEFTAAIVRAFLSNGLQDQLPFKTFYHGPAFRYERPQKGRLRQFHQLGVELIGAPEVQADIEMISLALLLLQEIELEKAVTLELNSLGDSESRSAYRQALVDYFSAHQAQLSDENRQRLKKNPLRILDSKDEGDKALCRHAPRMHDHFNDASKTFFAQLCEGLDRLGIAYHVNNNLVRGLDYYNHTVFEFTTDRLGAQGTVLAGGRYDGLVKLMGGADLAGIGFAAGIERLLALRATLGIATGLPRGQPIALIPLGEAAEAEMLPVAYRLRKAGFVIEHAYKGNMSKRLKKADKQGSVAAIILGEDELSRGEVLLRNLATGEQRSIALTELADALEAYKH